jgi:hypothetical protein
MVPVTQEAELEFKDGAPAKIYPFWPAHIRVCSTPPEGIDGKLVYVGECICDQIKPASLSGQIAVIEASAGERWSEPFYAGARAELVLGSDQTSWADLKAHDLRIPVDYPRFYVPPGKLADDLRAGRLPSATLKASVSWQRKTATNFFALVRPAQKAPGSAALMFSVPLDSTSLVPDLGPGAGQAVQVAAGLALLRELSTHPWNRPVMVFFSGADGIQFLGTRNMFLALGTSPAEWREEMSDLADQIKTAQHDLQQAQGFLNSPTQSQFAGDSGLVERLSQIIDLDIAQDQDRLFRLRAIPLEQQSPSQKQDETTLDQHQLSLQQLKFSFHQNPAALAADQQAAEYVRRTIERLGGQPSVEGLIQQYRARSDLLQSRIDLYRWLADAEGRPDDPAPGRTNNRLVELMIGLDLSDHGERAGPMYFGYFQRASGIAPLALFNDWFAKLERDYSAGTTATKWWSKPRAAINLETLEQLEAPTSYLAGPLPIPSELAQVWATPGLSMITLNDLRLHRDTPTDTLANLQIVPIIPQLNAICTLFAHASADPKFKGPVELKRLDVSFTGQVVSSAPGNPVPDMPRAGFLATYYYITSLGGARMIPPLGDMQWTLGIRRGEIQDCDAEGNYRFEGLPRLRPDQQEGTARALNDLQTFEVNAYRMQPGSGEIVATSDTGKQSEDMRSTADIKQDVPPIRSLVFDCEQFSLTGLYDPRFLQTLEELAPLDAVRDAEPKRFCFWLDNKMLAGFVEPGLRSELLIRFGQVGNRLILLNIPKSSPEPIGFTPDQFNHLGPLAIATTRDFFRLDDRRLADYRRAGVSSSLIDALHDDAGKHLAMAKEDLAKDDDVSLTRDINGAWASEARVYDAAQDMARNVIRAAIFLLMVCIPFSFCMERLLIATPSVYKQIAGVSVIFLLMTLALWSFHPAFKISSSPLIIILAFAIIGMSGLVIFVIYNKFDSELKILRSGRGSAVEPSFANAGVMMSAVLLGIANMRKRKFGTFLTSITIVLITFAVLWFTSTAHYLGTTTIPTGLPSSHSGILLRQRGFRPIQPILIDQLRAVLDDPALGIGRPKIVQQWWAVSSTDPKEQYNLTVPAHNGHPAREIGIPAVLGLSQGESELSEIGSVIGATKFARLEKGEPNVIYLSNATAKDLGVAEGDHLRLAGIDLQIAGVFDGDAFDQKVSLLSGESIAPLRYSAGELDAGGQGLSDTTSAAVDLDGKSGAAEAGRVYEHLAASQIAIVPAEVCRKLLQSTLRVAAFRLQNEQQVQRVSDDVTRRFSLATYGGYDDGVRMIVAGNLSSISGASQVAIPLAIAGLIIFNTMMGSIADRKREIHIYTSLGLATMHVGALFVAEAMTYGLIGTVFGYIFGQAIGTAMLKMGWLGSVTLNYSGTSAMLTMGGILLIVLLSALVPARVASKIAAPSIDRTWKVPTPHDDEIRAMLPFTINRVAADGALAYLAEYLDSHREGNIGKFATDKVEPFGFEEPTTNVTSRALRTTVWLTPFDLGVRQQMMLLIHPGQQTDIFEVQVRLQRLSGDDGSWYRMNKTFLTELRKQFLQWRSLSPARMLEYGQQSKALFEKTNLR